MPSIPGSVLILDRDEILVQLNIKVKLCKSDHIGLIVVTLVDNTATHQHEHGANLAQFWRGVARVGGA